jgi:hypothetical protein
MVLANWQRILTATDFSPLGNQAVEYAMVWPRNCGENCMCCTSLGTFPTLH